MDELKKECGRCNPNRGMSAKASLLAGVAHGAIWFDQVSRMAIAKEAAKSHG